MILSMPPAKPYLSKSRLISAWQCPKRLHLEKHHPELGEVSPMTESLFATGHDVGAVAQAFYGTPESEQCWEDTPTRPINPYGTSKLMTEWMLRDLAAAGGPRYVVLRYFNVAGCEPTGTIGQSTPKATLLVKVACEAATGRRPGVSIFGTDYPTPDGTAIRDYIHIADLASGHVAALESLADREGHRIYNLGTGQGASVLEVLDELRDQGLLKTEGSEDSRMTFHDPCQLVRRGGVVEQPRNLMKMVATDFVEMNDHGAMNWCCGAGGGNMWYEMEEEDRMNLARVRQAVETGAETVATACSF